MIALLSDREPWEALGPGEIRPHHTHHETCMCIGGGLEHGAVFMVTVVCTGPPSDGGALGS
jgi:hypothetical protein